MQGLVRYSATFCLFVAALLVGPACTPDIGPGTYWCGPERHCPPDQACNDNTFTCEEERTAERFSCPVDSETYEPDGDIATARDMGPVVCGNTLIGGVVGCIAAAGNVDLYRFELDTSCGGADPHLEAKVNFPIGLVGLQVELLDSAGTVVTSGELCTESLNLSGKERVCLDASLTQGVYYLRIQVAADAPDCNGDCHNNQYVLDVRYPLS